MVRVVFVTLLLISNIGLISVLVPTLLQDIIEMSANGEIVADWWDRLIEIYGVRFLYISVDLTLLYSHASSTDTHSLALDGS